MKNWMPGAVVLWSALAVSPAGADTVTGASLQAALNETILIETAYNTICVVDILTPGVRVFLNNNNTCEGITPTTSGWNYGTAFDYVNFRFYLGVTGNVPNGLSRRYRNILESTTSTTPSAREVTLLKTADPYAYFTYGSAPETIPLTTYAAQSSLGNLIENDEWQLLNFINFSNSGGTSRTATIYLLTEQPTITSPTYIWNPVSVGEFLEADITSVPEPQTPALLALGLAALAFTRRRPSRQPNPVSA